MPKFKIPKEEEVKLPELRVKFKDIFDLKEFYTALREYLNDNDWKDIEDRDEHWESQYGEHVRQGGVKEMWIWWRLHKVPKNQSYITYYLDFDWHNLGIQETEIIREGLKLKVHKGEVEIYIKPYMQLNFVGEFNKHAILKHFTKLFKSRIYHSQYEKKKKELYQETYALQNFMKQWFKFKRYLPYEERIKTLSVIEKFSFHS